MALLEVKNLNVKVDEKEILKNFSFELESGKVYVLMGPNGCGKSTLLDSKRIFEEIILC